MIMGGCIGIVGTVLLTRIGLGTPSALWATYLVVAGFGLGMGVQVPFTALQVVLRSDSSTANLRTTKLTSFPVKAIFQLAMVGSAMYTVIHTNYKPQQSFCSFRNSERKCLQEAYTVSTNVHRSAAIAIGQSLFINGLLREIPKLTEAIDPHTVVSAGPLNLKALATSPAVLHALRSAYSLAVRDTMYYSLAAVCITIPFAFGMQWLNVKKAARNKDVEEEELVRLA